MNEFKFKISGFHCDACVRLATMKIKKIEGVENVVVMQDGETIINANRQIVLAEVADVLKDAGYLVEQL